MNIAMLVYSHYSRDARVRRYAEALARKGFKVDVICLKENYHAKDKNISLLKYPLPRRRFGRLWYMVEYFFFSLYSSIILTINYFRKRYKFIHIHNMPDFLVFSSIIPKIFGAKVILDMHDPMPELYMSKFHVLENDLMVKWLKWFEKISISFADQVITANPEFKIIFISRNPQFADKITIILNCPDPRIFKNSKFEIRNSKFTLMYMGTVEKRFGLDIAVDAIPILVKKIPNIKFLIIPKLEEEGEYLVNLKLEASNLKLEKYIQFLEPLPLEKIADKLQEADIGVVLARNGIFTQIIFPVKLLEFIQMGIPVIATRTKVLSQYFNDKMIYFLEKNNSGEFSKAVLKLFKYKKAGTDLANNAKFYLKKNNWPNEEKKYLELISTISTH